jgi:hypothetical protein
MQLIPSTLSTPFLLSLTLLVAGTLTAQAADNAPSASDIVAKANHVAYYQGADGRADVTMTITDQRGGTRERIFTILRKDVDNDTDERQQFYVYFRRPADLNGMVFMVHKQPGSDDNRWLYLSDLDLVKRISAADKRTSFVGSHFLYEDVSGRHIEADDHVLESSDDTYYVIRSTPKDAGSVEYASSLSYIHKASHIVVQISYYDSEGTELRRYNALDVQTIQGFATVTRSQMTDMRTNANTVLNYRDLSYDLGLDDATFSERALRNPPQSISP